MRLRATSGGNLPFAARRREALDIHFIAARFVRDVREPTIVRRNAAVCFVELRLENHIGLHVAEEWQYPEVGACLGVGTFKNYELSVTRPIHAVGYHVCLKQQFLIARPARNFSVDPTNAASP